MSTIRVIQAASALLISQSLLGCAEVLDLPSDPQLAGPWRCLEAPSKPLPPAARTARVRFHACDFISECTQVVTGLNARLCDKLDVGCMSPRQQDIIDQDGDFVFDVPTDGGGFDGYLQVVPPLAPCYDSEIFGEAGAGFLCSLNPACDPAVPTEACLIPTYSPVLWFFNPPVVEDTVRAIPLQFYPTAALPLVVAAAGGSLDPTSGAVFMTTVDCDGRPAAGINYELSANRDVATSLYFSNGVISNSALQTDSTGVGGFVRVPPGFVEVTGLSGDSVAVGQIGVQAVPGFVTYTVLVPEAGR